MTISLHSFADGCILAITFQITDPCW